MQLTEFSFFVCCFLFFFFSSDNCGRINESMSEFEFLPQTFLSFMLLLDLKSL